MPGFVLGDVKRGGLLALGAAILFGASTPAAKAVVAGVHPLMLAGLLYLGSGLGLSIVKSVGRQSGARLKRADMPWLLGTVLFGGGIGPALLMFGLTNTTGSAASLLLTLEGVFTALLAWIVFREPFNKRIGFGMASIFVGAVLLAARGPSGHSGLVGALAIAGAWSSRALAGSGASSVAASSIASRSRSTSLICRMISSSRSNSRSISRFTWGGSGRPSPVTSSSSRARRFVRSGS